MKKKILFCVFCIIILFFISFNSKTTKKINTKELYKYETNIEVTGYTDEVLMNPGKGFTSMYESIDADCINLISTMYYRFDWEEIETADGVYNWNIIDYYINMAKKRNKKIAFGVMNASTSANSAYVTPKWVFDKGAQYTITTNEYGNEQFVPVWDDPIYLEEMNQFIQALGERYDGNENIAFIDIRGYGNWGEQHNYKDGLEENQIGSYISAEQLKELYIEPYMESFPNTLLVNPWGIREYDDIYKWAIDNGVSVRRDGIMEYDNQYVRGQEVFEYAVGKLPTMFEYHANFRNKIEDPNVTDLNMEYLWQYILDWKPTYIEMLPELYQKEPEWVERIANKVGYYFKYTGGEYENNITNSENTTIKIDFLNDGVAPLYEPCTVYMGILDKNNNLVKKIKTNIDAKQWMPNETKQENISISYSGIKNGQYKLAIGLFLNEDDDNPTYLIANTGKTDENWYTIGNVTVRNIEVSDIGDLDCDTEITAFDAYLALKYSIADSIEQKIIRVADIDEDGAVTSFDAYKILKKSIEVIDEEENYNNRIYTDKNGITIAKKQGISEPWLPTSKAEILNNDIATGLTIKDEDKDEWVWIEVPKTIYTDSQYTTDLTANAQGKKEVTSETDYDGIYKVLNRYASTYRGNWKDEWYDRFNATVIGTINGKKYVQIRNISNTNFSEVKNYYGKINTNTELTENAGNYYDESKKYYAEMTDALLGDTTGCGLTYTQYVNQYQRMLGSVYVNGGFWIGRYEASKGTTAPLSQKEKLPQVYISCSKAQIEAAKVAISDTTNNPGTKNYTSSLMFGIQWDLVCRFLEESSEWDTQSHPASWYITTDSSSWGVYSIGDTHRDIALTGSDFTKRRNIYDIAGNVWEWTLEHAIVSWENDIPCGERGGYFYNTATTYPASSRYALYTWWEADADHNRIPCFALLE